MINPTEMMDGAQCIAKLQTQVQGLLESEERFRSLIDAVPGMMTYRDREEGYLFCNKAYLSTFAFDGREVIGLTTRAVIGEIAYAEVQPHYARTLAGETVVTEREHRWPDGRLSFFLNSYVPHVAEDGAINGFFTLIMDITERKLAEWALRESEARFRSLTALSSDWYWEQDADFQFVLQEGGHASGDDNAFHHEQGKTFWELGFEIDGGWDAHHRNLVAGLPFKDVIVHRRYPDQVLRHLRISGEPKFDADRCVIGYRGVGRDITEQKRAEERIQFLATHDGLTGLPNRDQFSYLLNLTLESARRYGRKFAVLFIDLDRFKMINDTLGHQAGDHVLKTMSTRFSQCLRSSDVVARLGGDEFVVIIQEVNNPEQVAVVAQKIIMSAMQPVLFLEQECQLSASVGICTYPVDAQDEVGLMKNADVAMYSAKEKGKSNFQFYSPRDQVESA